MKRKVQTPLVELDGEGMGYIDVQVTRGWVAGPSFGRVAQQPPLSI
ncbi:MAG: hypothetical protein WCQ50_22410 [Spirochaetota bacterium]